MKKKTGILLLVVAAILLPFILLIKYFKGVVLHTASFYKSGYDEVNNN